jgi:hypothetical protein
MFKELQKAFNAEDAEAAEEIIGHSWDVCSVPNNIIFFSSAVSVSLRPLRHGFS